jgi:hypothetical protein
VVTGERSENEIPLRTGARFGRMDDTSKDLVDIRDQAKPSSR